MGTWTLRVSLSVSEARHGAPPPRVEVLHRGWGDLGGFWGLGVRGLGFSGLGFRGVGFRYISVQLGFKVYRV